MNNINDRLKAIRRAAGLSQNEFGEQVGCARMTVCCWEQGTRVPTMATQKFICKTYGINPEWLETGEGEMYANNGDDAIISRIVEEYNGDSLFRAIISAYVGLSDESKVAVDDFIRDIAARSLTEEEQPRDTVLDATIRAQRAKADSDGTQAR